MTVIKQRTPEWVEAKQSRIGGSEIYSLIDYYILPSERPVEMNEPPFRSALELFMKVKYGCKLSEIDPVASEFGNGMEQYIINRAQRGSILRMGRTDDFIISTENNLMCCSPDGGAYIFPSLSSECQILDFDDKTEINESDGTGIVECKTTNFYENFKAEHGMKWQYIFQLQYNMLVAGKKWGIGALLVPKEKEFDNDFFKGRMLERVNYDQNSVDEYYNLYLYPYLAKPKLQEMCLLALERFQKALDEGNHPAFSKNSATLLREKKLLADLYPERFGEKDISDDPDLDSYLPKLAENAALRKEIEAEENRIKAELIKRMGSHEALIGTNYKAYFDKVGFKIRKFNRMEV